MKLAKNKSFKIEMVLIAPGNEDEIQHAHFFDKFSLNKKCSICVHQKSNFHFHQNPKSCGNKTQGTPHIYATDYF